MVVSITNISPQHGSRYYTVEGNYPDEEQRDRSNWRGKLTATLNVDGAVKAHEFKQLLQGRSPDGNILVNKNGLKKRQQSSRERAGIDLTTSAPKSVSIQALVFGDRRLEEAHQRATAQMLAFLEERYATTRQVQDGQRRKVLTGKLAIAQFHHDTSRELDPQLHTHNIILNLQEARAGQWRSLDNEAIYRTRTLLGLVYRNELAWEVQKLGYEIQITHSRHGFWELKGYSPRQLEQFSKRSQQIQKVAGEDATSRYRALITVSSGRKRKQVLPRKELEVLWREEAASTGIQAIAGAGGQTVDDGAIAQAVVNSALHGLSGQKEVFRREEIERNALLQVGQTNLTAIEEAIDQHSSLLPHPDSKGNQRYTYHQHSGDSDDTRRFAEEDRRPSNTNALAGLRQHNPKPAETSDSRSYPRFPTLQQFREERRTSGGSYPDGAARRDAVGGMATSHSSDRRPDRAASEVAQTIASNLDSTEATAGDAAEFNSIPPDGFERNDSKVADPARSANSVRGISPAERTTEGQLERDRH